MVNLVQSANLLTRKTKAPHLEAVALLAVVQLLCSPIKTVSDGALRREISHKQHWHPNQQVREEQEIVFEPQKEKEKRP